MDLNELALKHRADKHSNCHDYCKLYERYMAPLRQEPVMLLEIGINKGHSLRMWREYFPEGRIYGVEKRGFDDPLVYHGSACDPEVIARMPNFDFIVDDGSHWGQDQVDSFNLLWEHLNPGGVYSVEDVTYAYTRRDNRQGLRKFFSLVHACNWHGKSVRASYESHGKNAGLRKLDREVEFVHFYTGIVFVGKRK